MSFHYLDPHEKRRCPHYCMVLRGQGVDSTRSSPGSEVGVICGQIEWKRATIPMHEDARIESITLDNIGGLPCHCWHSTAHPTQ
eukprot:4090675-Amphidinium_carterae.1